ncbi:acyl-CoA dehydrogenase [Wenzhouxiangella marina]|uniref:Acyl-coenzyme A dehydrogenase n=1 Tax=Wenzhouxiangella marina TaxID=1579979 RepID=A0A0K0XX73_9GAMM|nr:acyl-CoA dehydrogenase [Wenzhouxiangella marina]AKS42280.1 acyl-CoA dehydrogenase [Wenzhouxiangella marina]MBB6085947.1 acyl-CoA dehydrogenase [Wenzhouxiangella marina]
MNILSVVLLFAGLGLLAYLRLPLWLAALASLIAAVAVVTATPLAWPVDVIFSVTAAALVFMALKPLRRNLLSRPLFNWFKTVLPAMSDTEKEALDAGTVWWDAELFSGRPKWKTLFDMPKPTLTEEEQAFVDGPVEELCKMLDDWKINRELKDLPPEVWQFIREKRFLSMIIPKEYGGLDFTAQGNAAVVTKLSTRSLTAAVSVMVPNSLGPGELLMHFGTDAQKKHYLPRLARGEDIPCFALTSPQAGSDAASMPDEGIVCKRTIDGKEVLGLSVSWDKRYITLAPVATVLGLAFKTRDPDGLLGGKEHLGITCALIPTSTPGVEIGNRHLPGGSLFMNGPTRGKDVFIPMDWVIGGQERIGQGWRMLMHCLAAGRAISLPAQSVAGGKVASMLTGAYARIRYQFKQPIGYFEGIEEPLARIGAEAYRMEAAHKLTLSALDRGDKPVVLSAILKAYLTEANRKVVNDAMDVHGGKAVVEGPNNYLSLGYQALPVSITVEGANILTRSMIVFGQGAIRCHPYLLKEMLAAQDDDLAAFDDALWRHVGYLISNGVRAPILGLTGGLVSPSPVSGPTARDFRRINRLCSAFTLTADLALLILGGKFKFAEKLSGRFADALAHLYMASATLRRFEDDGRPSEDLPLVRYAVDDSLHQVEEALHGVYRNFPMPGLGPILKWLCFPTGRRHARSDDRTGHRIARLLLEKSASRDRLIHGAFMSDVEDGTGLVLKAFDAVLKAEPAEHALRNALKQVPSPSNIDALCSKALAAGVITEEQAEDLKNAQALSARVIAVDEFTPAELQGSQSEAPPALAEAS